MYLPSKSGFFLSFLVFVSTSTMVRADYGIRLPAGLVSTIDFLNSSAGLFCTGTAVIGGLIGHQRHPDGGALIGGALGGGAGAMALVMAVPYFLHDNAQAHNRRLRDCKTANDHDIAELTSRLNALKEENKNLAQFTPEEQFKLKLIELAKAYDAIQMEEQQLADRARAQQKLAYNLNKSRTDYESKIIDALRKYQVPAQPSEKASISG